MAERQNRDGPFPEVSRVESVTMGYSRGEKCLLTKGTESAPEGRQGTRQLSEETQLEGWVSATHHTTDTDPHSHLSLRSRAIKGIWGCHTESTVLLLPAWDVPGNHSSICWYF